MTHKSHRGLYYQDNRLSEEDHSRCNGGGRYNSTPHWRSEAGNQSVSRAVLKAGERLACIIPLIEECLGSVTFSFQTLTKLLARA